MTYCDVTGKRPQRPILHRLIDAQLGDGSAISAQTRFLLGSILAVRPISPTGSWRTVVGRNGDQQWLVWQMHELGHALVSNHDAIGGDFEGPRRTFGLLNHSFRGHHKEACLLDIGEAFLSH